MPRPVDCIIGRVVFVPASRCRFAHPTLFSSALAFSLFSGIDNYLALPCLFAVYVPSLSPMCKHRCLYCERAHWLTVAVGATDAIAAGAVAACHVATNACAGDVVAVAADSPSTGSVAVDAIAGSADVIVVLMPLPLVPLPMSLPLLVLLMPSAADAAHCWCRCRWCRWCSYRAI